MMIATELAVSAVTILEDRASITRTGTRTLAAGQHRLVVERVAPVLVDKTLTAAAQGARVLDVRCERYLAPWRDPAAASESTTLDTLRSERHRLERERDTASAVEQGAKVELDGLAALLDAAVNDLAVSASRGVRTENASSELASLDAAHAAAYVRWIEASLARRDAEAALERLAARIGRAEAEAGQDAARIIVDLVLEAEGEIALTVGYVVPGAAWRPYHRAVLDRAAGRIEWQTTACVWQATGEDWREVDVTFSLERPSLGVEPPALADDVLHTRRKPEHVVVEAREHEQQTTGLGGGPLQVPGIDDGGLGITLTAARATILADGMPHRIDVGGFASSAQIALVAIPLRSPFVHVRARLANTGTLPLLAGPVDLVMSAGHVGRAEVGFVAAGEKFDLGFGPEAEVRVHRSEERERDAAGLLGWNVQTVKVAVRLSNLGTTPREITVIERVPVSEVEQVEVQVAESNAYRLTGEEQVTGRAVDEHGLVTWTVELPPQGRRAVTLQYKVRSQRNVAGI